MGHDGFAFAVHPDKTKWKNIKTNHPQGDPISHPRCHAFMCTSTTNKSDGKKLKKCGKKRNAQRLW